ncbi:MAG: site-2 protease family protein [Saprospiraceae bacterium]|nr:site-2 protease family protein [Saprospiraceae bacterium]
MRNLILTLLFIAFTLCAHAQEAIRYLVNLDKVQHHEIEVTIEFASLPKGVFEVRMPNSSPGRYAAHNFAKNVYNEKAFNSKNEPIQVNKTDIAKWQIAGHDGIVKFQYTLYANHGDGTYAGFNNRGAIMNMPATFAYGVNLEHRPIELSIDLSKHPDWKVATQLKQLDNNRFWSPNYYYFYDSPTTVGDIKFRSWEVESNGKNYTIEIAMMHEGTDAELDSYTEMVKKVVDAQKAVYGSLPDYDFGKYTFLCNYNPWIFGDGMEHRNSTVCNANASLATAANRVIGTISHEFFHCWNVERIRPNSLEPFDFDKPNMSGELWFAEGFTSYYTNLILCRAGIMSPEAYINSLSSTINAVVNSPARKYRNVIQMSQHAPYVDAAVSIDENNYANTFISYYTYGSFLGLTLDLSIRNQFPNKGLDDVMRYMWENFGKPEIPYEIADLQKAVASVTGDPAFAANFFNRYIYDSYLPDPKTLLSNMGVSTELRNPGKPDFINLRTSFNKDGIEIRDNVLENNSLYEAGLNRGDKIVAIDNQIIKSEEDYNNIITKLKIGKSYSIVFEQNSVMQTSKFTVKEDPAMSTAIDEKASANASRKRGDWLKN